MNLSAVGKKRVLQEKRGITWTGTLRREHDPGL